MKPGPQPDGWWYVPMLPVRKDALGKREGQAKPFRPAAYDKSRKEFESYLVGWKMPLIEKPRRVRMELVMIVPDLIRRDTDNSASAAKDWLEGVAYSDDSQIWEYHEEKRLERGVRGLLFRVSEVTP